MRLGRRRKGLERGEYPPSFTNGWLQLVLPSASPAEARGILEGMRRMGWTEAEVAERLLPFMPPEALEPAPEGETRPGGETRLPEPSPAAAAEPPRPAAAEPPPVVEVPSRVSTRWLDSHLPAMDRTQIRLVVEELERRGWAPSDLAVAVLPHLLPKLPREDADAILAGLRDLGLGDDEITRLTPDTRRGPSGTLVS